MSKLIESSRYLETVWCICNNFLDYKQFAKDIYTYKKRGNFFGGEQFEYEEEWFGKNRKNYWMDLFGIPYIKSDPNDKYSEDIEIENPLIDIYEITEKPKDSEYPVIVRYSLVDNSLDWCSIKTGDVVYTYETNKEDSQRILENPSLSKELLEKCKNVDKKHQKDNGNPITNAERISTLLKIDSDSAADEIWNETILNAGCIDYHDFRKWLKEESK